MKKNLTLVSLMLGVMLIMMVGAVSAYVVDVELHDVDLNDLDQVTVSPGETITASVQAEADSNDPWKSTEYLIEGGSWICVNTPDHNDGTYWESFSITAPLAEGTYDFSVKVYQNEGCSNEEDSDTLVDGIIVVEEEGCDACTIDIVEPLAGEYFCNEDVLIDWEASETCSSTTKVFYGIWDNGECDLVSPSLDEVEVDTEFFPWNVGGLSDGAYCVHVENGCCPTDTEGPICVDCTKPTVEICVGDACCPDGIESDEQTSETETTIEILSINDPDNGCNQQCELVCTIDWGDDSELESCPSEGEYSHQYADDGEYDIVVSVEDCAGNVGTDEDTATVENVPPTCEIEVLSSDLVVGLPIEFQGTAWDVIADLEIMTWEWNFDNGDSETTYTEPGYSPSVGYSSIAYTYDEEDTYNVVLKVEDDTYGGVGTCSAEIEVVAPTVLDDQQLALCECLDADFGEMAGEASNSFETGLDEEELSCEFITEVPSGLHVLANEDGECVVTWCFPHSWDIGTHTVFIKAEDGDDTEYFTFDIELFRYGIHFDEGWNLFSIPLVPENDDTSIDSVLGQLLEEGSVAYVDSSTATVLQYDAVEDKWYKARPYSDYHGFTWGSQELTEIKPGYGYWINMDEATTLYLNGEKMYNADSSAYPPEVTLAMDSWNLIGVYGISECCFPFIGVSDALVSLTDEESNAYYDIIYNENGYPPFMDLLKSKEGYWLSVKKVFAGDETIQYKANYYGDTHWFPPI